MALQGLTSVVFSFAGISLTLENINFVTLILIVTMVIWWVLHHSKTQTFVTKPSTRTNVLPSHLLSFLLALTAGMLFFTVDLIPSSMTGDPARHFMSLIDPTKVNLARAYKPIYTLWAGVFIHSFPSVQEDKLFVLFNIFTLGLTTSSCLLLFTNLLPAARIVPLFTAALFVCFGYPLFALHYGYYTLLLSSAFLFSALALLIEYQNFMDRKLYFVVTILVIGVVLTHSYLAPDALLVLIGFAYWNARRQGQKVLPELVRYMPFWMLIVLVAVASNSGLLIDNAVIQVVTAKGFVNDNVWLNLLPFLPFAGSYFFFYRKDEPAQVLLLFIMAAGIFSLAMGICYWHGAVAAYYLNRNQIILLPLLILATVALLQTLELRHAALSRLLYIIAALVVIAPYLFIYNSPLSSNNISFSDLLNDEQLVYLENAINTSFSPLQMTDRDRTLMREIGRQQSNCFPGISDKVAVLGTDHEVIWFYLYTHIYPSLFLRKDGFINLDNYLDNYQEWKSNPSYSDIVVLSHFDFWNQRNILNDIRSRASLVCKGDSIEIYRKTKPDKPAF